MRDRRTQARRGRTAERGEHGRRRSRARTGGCAAPGACPPRTTSTYHDEEWGRPVHGDDALFERLCLEAFQSGLSWITILRRREGFRTAFAGFKIAEVAAFTDADKERLLADAGIIRNRAKIEATIANARVARRAGRRASWTR